MPVVVSRGGCDYGWMVDPLGEQATALNHLVSSAGAHVIAHLYVLALPRSGSRVGRDR